jgi:hypothetical protein
MNRMWSGRSSDSDGRSLQYSTHRWTGTTARAASLDYSEWSEKRGAGLARLGRVEGGDSGRTGPGDDPRFTVKSCCAYPTSHSGV